MSIFNSTWPMRRMLEMGSHVISETAYSSFRNFTRGLLSLHSLFCWVLIMGLFLLTASGCDRSKEELASAKQQIETLSSDVKELTDETAHLKQETNRLSDESKTLSDKNKQLKRDLDDVNKSKVALTAQNDELRKKNSAAEKEIASLKGEKARLVQENEKLKQSVAETTSSGKSRDVTSTEVGPRSANQTKELSPCDAVAAFMKASEEVVRRQKGTERAKSLKQVKRQYAPKMKGAPRKAIKAAEKWVKVGTKFWDQVGGEGTLQLIQLRNTVLEACGKSPKEAGF